MYLLLRGIRFWFIHFIIQQTNMLSVVPIQNAIHMHVEIRFWDVIVIQRNQLFIYLYILLYCKQAWRQSSQSTMQYTHTCLNGFSFMFKCVLILMVFKLLVSTAIFVFCVCVFSTSNCWEIIRKIKIMTQEL